MDLRKAITVIASVCLALMMVYLLVFKKAPEKKDNPAAAPKEKETEQEYCEDYEKAIVKTGRVIKNSAVWASTDGPYVVTGDLIIGPKAVFELKPGVVVKFRGKNTNFIVKGKLVAKGTEEKPVIITSFNDDSAGGDTNCDKKATKPSDGDYGSIIISGKKSLSHCEFRYAKEVRQDGK
ncbi:MAG TPA: hypothetical protein P5511_09940 [Candidatus Goldiibacteriota bacterium]|nr:hypothetical protein [Candidatus Goldiibacteriota bacterium]